MFISYRTISHLASLAFQRTCFWFDSGFYGSFTPQLVSNSFHFSLSDLSTLNHPEVTIKTYQCQVLHNFCNAIWFVWDFDLNKFIFTFEMFWYFFPVLPKLIYKIQKLIIVFLSPLDFGPTLKSSISTITHFFISSRYFFGNLFPRELLFLVKID